LAKLLRKSFLGLARQSAAVEDELDLVDPVDQPALSVQDFINVIIRSAVGTKRDDLSLGFPLRSEQVVSREMLCEPRCLRTAARHNFREVPGGIWNLRKYIRKLKSCATLVRAAEQDVRPTPRERRGAVRIVDGNEGLLTALGRREQGRATPEPIARLHRQAPAAGNEAVEINFDDGITRGVRVRVLSRIDERVDGEELPRVGVVVAVNYIDAGTSRMTPPPAFNAVNEVRSGCRRWSGGHYDHRHHRHLGDRFRRVSGTSARRTSTAQGLAR
jgi:hypothetical protein